MTDELVRMYEEVKAFEIRKKEKNRKIGQGCLTVIAVFFLLIVIANIETDAPEKTAKLESESPSTAAPPSKAALEAEYTVYFEKPCLQSARYDDDNVKLRAGWKDRLKKGIINQARKYELLSERKKLYAAKVNNCKNIIKDSQGQSAYSSLRTNPDYVPDYTAEIEKYVIDRCLTDLVRIMRPGLPAPDSRQLHKIKAVMKKDVEKTTKQILPRVQGKPYRERLAVYESSMGGCRLP